MAKAKNEVISNIFDEIEPTEQDSEIWGSFYLPIQWQNLLGKWEFPLEHWGGSMLEFDHEVVQVRHQSNMVDGFLLDSINIAPFAVKTHWGYRDATSGKYIMAEKPLDDVNPWRSRVHVLALLKESESMTPVILTAGSNTGKHLLNNIATGQRRIENMLKRIGYGDRPSRLFWMEMVAGKLVEVGEGETTNTICPPVALAPVMNKITKPQIIKYLSNIYVGHDIRDAFQDHLLEEGEVWSAKQPERLLLDDGTNGGDNVALPPAMTNAVVLDDGSLHLPDLASAKQAQMIECSMSVPGLFTHERHAGRAFAGVVKGGSSKANQWAAWKAEILKRWDSQQEFQASQNRAAEDRGLSAMDEVEADAK